MFEEELLKTYASIFFIYYFVIYFINFIFFLIVFGCGHESPPLPTTQELRLHQRFFGAIASYWASMTNWWLAPFVAVWKAPQWPQWDILKPLEVLNQINFCDLNMDRQEDPSPDLRQWNAWRVFLVWLRKIWITWLTPWHSSRRNSFLIGLSRDLEHGMHTSAGCC